MNRDVLIPVFRCVHEQFRARGRHCGGQILVEGTQCVDLSRSESRLEIGGAHLDDVHPAYIESVMLECLVQHVIAGAAAFYDRNVPAVEVFK